MPDLRPFRGVRYDPRAVADLGAVLCPPYDVIEQDERDRLLARHPRNAVRLELPDDYADAARLFEEWQADGTLLRDDRPMVYVYEQQYDVPGVGRRSAVGFFCRLRLDDYGAGVRRHERTHDAPKEDRYRLLAAVRANLSPVLMLYEDGAGGAAVEALLAAVTRAEPTAHAVDGAGNGHWLWAVDPTSPVARSLLERAGSGPLTIADGHHRYETALRFRRAVPAADSVLVLLYEASSGGLTVLPTHRLVRGAGRGASLFDAAAGAGLDVRRLGPGELMRDLTDRLTPPGIAFGAVTREGRAVISIDDAGAAALLGPATPRALRRLPVAVLDAALERWTGATVADLVADGRIIYSKEARTAVDEVAAGSAEAAFVLPPTPIATVLEVAALGEVMPQKSTYFQPKAATGLLFDPVLA